MFEGAALSNSKTYKLLGFFTWPKNINENGQHLTVFLHDTNFIFRRICNMQEKLFIK